MNSLNDLKSILFLDIKMNNELKKKASYIDTYIDLYSELLDLFTVDDIDNIFNNLLQISIILDCLYDKDTIKSFDILKLIYGWRYAIDEVKKEDYVKKLSRLALKFKIDCGLELDRAKEIRSHVLSIDDEITTKRIISSLKYGQVITDEQLNYVKERLDREKVEPRYIIIILERIKIHNAKLKSMEDRRINYRELYYIINLLNQGFEQIDLPVRDNPTLDEFCNNFVETFNNTPFELCENVLDGITFYNHESMEYVYKKIMQYYQEKIYDIIDTLKSIYFYFDNEVIGMVKEEYNSYYFRYMVARNALDELKKREIEESAEEIVEESEEYTIRVDYATNSDVPEKCWFIRDLMDVREESLEKIGKLMNDFKKGKRSNLKPLRSLHGYSEIKDDQIRIVFKPMGSNMALIMGVFIKKSTSDDPNYRGIIGRQTIEVGEDYSKEVEDYYKRYIEENSRKGSRA